jgi:aspartyl-tRNA(Asn)/glutamyl-tRNA(Gln) amidotransferase subunit C
VSATSLTLDEVHRIAALARLKVSDAEAEHVLAQLHGIFALVEQMRSVGTSGVEPMSHPIGGTQRLRDDVVTETDSRSANLANAPAQENGLFLVPKVIEP